MENGPRRTIDFDKLTNTQLYNVFLEAVKVRDVETVKECIKRDGLFIKPNSITTVPMYFAYINDRASCEFLESFHDLMPFSFVYGALLGDHVDLIKHYLKNYNLREYLDTYLSYAGPLDKIEILKSCWYPDHMHDFLKHIENSDILPKAVMNHETLMSQEKTEALLIKYPDDALYIMVARNEIAMLFNFLASHNTKLNWQKALGDALALQRFDLVEQILPQVVDTNCAYIISNVIHSGDLNKVLFYFNKYKHLCSNDDIVKFASIAAKKGEIVIADFLVDQLTTNIKMWCYLCLAKDAQEYGFVYAANYFTSRFEMLVQTVFTPLPKRSTSTKKNSQVNVKQTPKHQSALLIAENKATPTSKLSALINTSAGSFLDIEKQSAYLDNFKEVKISSDDLNILLEQVLLVLEGKKLILLSRVKGQIYISESEPAYPVLRELALNHSWLDRSKFLMARAKLVTVTKSTTVPLSKFFDFYNALCDELKLLKDKPTATPSASPVLVRRVAEPAADVPVIVSDALIVPKSKLSSSYTPNFNGSTESQSKGKDHKPAHKIHHSSGKPHKTKPMTAQPKKKEQLKRQEQPYKQDQPVKPQPLPPKGDADLLQLGNARLLDLLAMQREDDAVLKKPRAEPKVQLSNHFDPLREVMLHMQKTQQALTRYKGLDVLLIHDLAILDLLLKINRDLDDEKFSTTFIHGMHHYLLQRTATFSTVSSFVRECFVFGSKEVINPFVRDSHDFMRCVRNVRGGETEPLDRLNIIRELFALQPICYHLSQSSDLNLAEVGRHALSGIIIAIGEQVQQLNDTEIDEQLAALPVYKILNEYRHYRNVRHGTDYTKQESDSTFHLVRDDWDKQLDNIISDFWHYFSKDLLDMLDVSETQESFKKMRI